MLSLISNYSFSATITVCPTGCDHSTIAAAVAAANPGDVIQISTGFYPASNILVDKNLNFQGFGASFIVGAFPNRLFRIASNTTVGFNNLIMTGGHVDVGGGILNNRSDGGAIYNDGTLDIVQVIFQNNIADEGDSQNGFGGGSAGAIYNSQSGVLNVFRSTFRDNEGNAGGSGGAICNIGMANIDQSTFEADTSVNEGGAIATFDGILNITNSTFTKNFTQENGGAIACYGGTVNLNFVTISDNTAGFPNGGGGIYARGNGIINVTNSIIANNIDRNGSQDCALDFSNPGIINLLERNVIEDGSCGCAADPDCIAGDPNLGPLADNGGATQTMVPVVCSPAISLASSSSINIDQRGFTRPQGAMADVGAIEVDYAYPTIACKNITVNLDASGNVTIAANAIDNGSQDPSCTPHSFSLSKTSFNCSDVGSNIVIMAFTNRVGVFKTCQANVTIVDNTAPTVLCKSGVVKTIGANGTVTITPQEIDNNSSDACGIANMSVIPNTFTCADAGMKTVTLTLTDINGNSESCSTMVEIIANPPIANCKDITVTLDNNGMTTIVADDIDISVISCPLLSRTVSPNTFDCSKVGPQQVVLTLIDQLNRTSVCTSTVLIVDNVPPTPRCMTSITKFLNTNGQVTITSGEIDNGSSDACGIASLSIAPNSFTCANVGQNTVTLTVTDNNMNVSTCITQVMIVDNVLPIAVCQDITVQLDATGNTSITTDTIDNGSSDACGIANLMLNKTTFTCSDVGPNTINLTVTDNNGNMQTCTATVVVQDTVSPIAICQDITVQLDDQGNASITPDTIDNGSNDACGIASLMLDNQAFTCADVGPNPVTLTVVDSNGNSSTCTATVTAKDTVRPKALCQNITVYLDKSGNVSITPEMIDNGSNDACGIKSLALDTSAFNCDDLGMNPVILTVTDNNDNVDTCHAMVMVEDIQIFTVPDIVGMSPMCPGFQTAPYSVVPDPNVTSYQWTYSGSGATISHNGKPNITIIFSPDATQGILTVEYHTICQPSGIKDNFSVVKGSLAACALATNCRVDDLLVSNIMISFPAAVNLFKATNSVSSQAVVEDSETVIFQAGQEINLFPDFEVESGAIFEAKIAGCLENIQARAVRKTE